MSHEIHSVSGKSNINYFHNEEIEVSPYKYQIDVSGKENYKE